MNSDEKRKLKFIFLFFIIQSCSFLFTTLYLYTPETQINLHESILVEVDTSYNINLSMFTAQSEAIFAKFGVNATFIYSQELNVSTISFSYENVSQFAYYSNSTKDYENSIHLLVIDAILVNNINQYWGYAPRASLWFNGFNQSNALNASFTSGIVAATKILNDTGNDQILLKVILHELGHLLGCGHDNDGIMQQGSTLELYFSQYSISQMNFNEIWSRDHGFDFYL